MDNTYNSFLKRLNQDRVKRNISQTKMGEILGMTQSYYSKVEKGKNLISFSGLIRLYEQSFDIDYLVTGIPRKMGVLDYYIDKCNENKKADMLNYIIWLVKQGLDIEKSKYDINEINEYYKVIYFIQYRNHIKKKCNVWRIIRNDNEKTQQQMADKLKINIKKYRCIENGKREPDVQILVELYSEFGYLPTMMLPEVVINISYLNEIWNKFSSDLKSRLAIYIDRCVDIINS